MLAHVFNLFALSLFSFCLISGHVPNRNVSAQAGATFGPETFPRGPKKKITFNRSFAVSDTEIPYTLTVINGASDGSSRAKKGWVTLNGNSILSKDVFNKSVERLVVAIHPAQLNDLTVKFKGAPGSFVSVSIEPTPGTLLNDPFAPDFDSNQAGVGFPFAVAVDQTTHRAYITDRYRDSVIEFDIEGERIERWFAGLDGDSIFGNGGTAGISFNPNARTLVAINEGSLSGGSFAVINPDSGSINVSPITSPGNDIHPMSVAVNPNNNIAAFTALFTSSGKRAYFINTATGALNTRDEDLILNSVAFNSSTNEFLFTCADGKGSPELLVYSAISPFQRIRRITSTARAGTSFERIAINPVTNIAAAVNSSDASAILFDLTSGTQIARIPILVGDEPNAIADIAINPLTNMAAVTTRFVNRVTVINLAAKLVMAEIPLPEGVSPLGVGIDHQLNRAVIAENGLVSNRRNGSLLVVQLPAL